MASDGQYPCGVALSPPLPDDPTAIRELYSRSPIAHQLLKQYARDHDTTVDALAYGDEVMVVEAPQLGYASVAAAANAQQQLRKQVKDIMEDL